MALSGSEKFRYSRHLSLPKFGIEAQEKLKAAKVLVIGAGGLGAPMLHYLTAAGIGTIGVVDFDKIDTSNLQRQVLFNDSEIGKSKSTIAIKKLQSQNPNVVFIEHNLKLDTSNAMDIIKAYDVVADGTDNFPTRYLVNDACILLNKPLIYGSIFQYEGQVSVFNYQNGPNYRDLFPAPPAPGIVPSCAEGGVLGVLPGIIGSMQANETIKVITGIGETLSGRLFLYDSLEARSRTVNIKKDPDNPISGETPTITKLIDYDEFCGVNSGTKSKSITVQELKNWIETDKKFVLIDVREPDEYEAGNMGGDILPLSDIENSIIHIPKDQTVVMHCKGGGRSAKAIALLEAKFGYSNLINLEGGILAWRDAFEK